MFSVVIDLPVTDDLINTIAHVNTLPDAETIALAECRRRMSSDKIMLEYVDDLFYGVFDGLDRIGGVKIRSL